MFKRPSKAAWKAVLSVGEQRLKLPPTLLATAETWLVRVHWCLQPMVTAEIRRHRTIPSNNSSKPMTRASRSTRGLLLAFPPAPSQPSFSCLHENPRSSPQDHEIAAVSAQQRSFLLCSHICSPPVHPSDLGSRTLYVDTFSYSIIAANLPPLFARKSVISLSLLLYEHMKGNQNVRTRRIGFISSNWHTWKNEQKASCNHVQKQGTLCWPLIFFLFFFTGSCRFSVESMAVGAHIQWVTPWYLFQLHLPISLLELLFYVVKNYSNDYLNRSRLECPHLKMGIMIVLPVIDRLGAWPVRNA